MEAIRTGFGTVAWLAGCLLGAALPLVLLGAVAALGEPRADEGGPLMHFCPQEAVAILASVPLLRLVWWRARRLGFEPGGQVRECRSCSAEIEKPPTLGEGC